MTAESEDSSSRRLPPRGFVPEPFAYHEEIELAIDSLTNEGQGVGRVKIGDGGWVVLVPFALPGERVRVRVFANRRSFSEADLVEVIEPSPDRVAPRCALFTRCGGCQYQHLAYPAQLDWKRRQVADLLRHQAGIEFPVDPVVASPLEFGYRSKITPHFQKPRKGGRDAASRGADREPEIPAIGFLHHGSRQRVLDVAQCPIASDAINRALPGVRQEVRQGASRFRRGATLLLRDAEGTVLTDPGEVAVQQVGDLTFRFLAGDFFQNNPSILPAFTSHVADEASACGRRFLIDAYCGSGLFALCAAQRFEQVVGVEISASSVDWARHNAEHNGITNCRFESASADAIFASVSAFPPAETAVVIDPPRKGCDEAFLRQLFAFGPSRVVYVSCNPATQLRDLQAFTENRYRLARVQPFDLFPQTKHLECVMTLVRG